MITRPLLLLLLLLLLLPALAACSVAAEVDEPPTSAPAAGAVAPAAPCRPCGPAADAPLFPGDRLRRRIAPDEHARFHLEARPGHYTLDVRPAADLDVAIDILDATGAWVGGFDDGGPGAAESTPVHAPQTLTLTVVVRGVTGEGAYELELR